MEGLSNDILELIFRQLENVSDMETCSKTCLKWNKIIGWINENLISCPFDGCSVKVTKLMLKDIRDHKMYCILNPEFQKLLQLLQDFNNITYVPDPKTGRRVFLLQSLMIKNGMIQSILTLEIIWNSRCKLNYLYYILLLI